MSILSSKELKRLQSVREMLSKGENPYSCISTLTIGGGEFITQDVVKELTPKQRLKKFKSNVNDKHQWSFIDGVLEVQPITITCIACDVPVQHVTSVYGRVLIGSFTIVRDGVKLINDTLTEYRTVLGVPKYKTGVVCEQCFNTLYADKWLDSEGTLHRSIEVLDRPVNKTQESVRKNHRTMTHTVPERRVQYQTKDDDLPSGKQPVTLVTDVYLDKNGDIEQEWKSTLAPAIPEEIDGNSYNYFRRGR